MAVATHRHQGDILDYVPGSNVSAGDVVVYGELIGVVLNDALAGERVGLKVEGVFLMPILGTDTPAAGAKLYWDAGNTRLTTTVSSTHKQAGWAVAAKASGPTTIECKLGKG